MNSFAWFIRTILYEVLYLLPVEEQIDLSEISRELTVGRDLSQVPPLFDTPAPLRAQLRWTDGHQQYDVAVTIPIEDLFSMWNCPLRPVTAP